VTETDQKVSDQLVVLIQVVFGFVLAQSFSGYATVILSPWEPQNRVAFFALLVIYITTVLSWMDWHLTMALRPYNLNPAAGLVRIEQFRVFSDLLIVSIYAFALLSVESLAKDAGGDALKYLWSFSAIFLGYTISGVLRRMSYGSLASSLRPILFFLALYVLLGVSYFYLRRSQHHDATALNAVAISLALLLMLAYRLVRRSVRERNRANKVAGLNIGVDVDGVLANQITGILPRLKRRFNVSLMYEDVTDWRLPVNGSDIAKEILIAMQDSDYLLSMPAHSHARDVVAQLYRSHSIKILTARPPESEPFTRTWLEKSGIQYDSLASVREKEKSLYATDILVDDYLGNIEDYLEETKGVAILVDQPWNRDRASVQTYIDQHRLLVTVGLLEIPKLVAAIRSGLGR
jgi:uncharacterized protein